MTLKNRVLTFIQQHPGWDGLENGEQNRRLYGAFPDASRGTLRKYKIEWRQGDRPDPGAGVPAALVPGGPRSPPPPAIPDFPGGGGPEGGGEERGLDELLMEATKRGLAARDPDPRWGSIAFRLLEGTDRLQEMREGGDEEWLRRARDMELRQVVDDMLGTQPRSGTSASGPSGGTSSPSGTSSASSTSGTDSRAGSDGASGGSSGR